jgi:hypothetical protein
VGCLGFGLAAADVPKISCRIRSDPGLSCTASGSPDPGLVPGFAECGDVPLGWGDLSWPAPAAHLSPSSGDHALGDTSLG